LVQIDHSIEGIKNDIRKANNRLEKATNKSSNTYKNGLKLRASLKKTLKDLTDTRKEYISIICSQNMIKALNGRIKEGENILKCPSNFPELRPEFVRKINRVLKKDVNDLRNELRRANGKRASTSGRP
jgi:transposase-like protein|tara:strand:+ start:803 stop:1186 length:384 start_codon:yes stop_codon:yes gene_type:complete